MINNVQAGDKCIEKSGSRAAGGHDEVRLFTIARFLHLLTVRGTGSQVANTSILSCIMTHNHYIFRHLRLIESSAHFTQGEVIAAQ